MLQFGCVNSAEDLERVAGFAASFDHEVSNKSTFPIITISKDDKLAAYYHVLRQPIIFPCFSTDPKVCSPRTFRESFDAIRNHVVQSAIDPRTYPNGVAFFALPAHTQEMYGEERIRKMGMHSNGTQLFCTIPQ